MNLKEANEVFRRAIIKAYFEPELLRMDYRKSSVKHPNISDAGLTIEDILPVYFDVYTGNDYPDGDEWFSVGLDLLRLRRIDESIEAVKADSADRPRSRGSRALGRI